MSGLEQDERGQDPLLPRQGRDYREIMTEQEFREKEQRDRLLDREIEKTDEEGESGEKSELLRP